MVTNIENLTIAQVRMARAALNLGIRELAELAEMSPNTIVRFERGESMHKRTIRDIRKALENAGVKFFIGDFGEVGVLIKID